MPHKTIICGIYAATTPSGKQYIGSSRNILSRWSHHRGELRRGKHHSIRLQHAWNKHGDAIAWSILLECAAEDLTRMEQAKVAELCPELNATLTINNVWSNPETVAKMRAAFARPEFKKLRSEIAKKHALKFSVAIDCSDGTSYPSQKAAGEAFGIKPAGINALVKTQRAGKLGVRFKRSSEEWRDVLEARVVRAQTRIRSGLGYGPETRKRMSEAAKRRGIERDSTTGRFA